MGTRYTIKNLEAHVAELNDKLIAANEPYRLVIEQFNGATWISETTPYLRNSGAITRRLDCGTPKEMRDVATQAYYNQVG